VDDVEVPQQLLNRTGRRLRVLRSTQFGQLAGVLEQGRRAQRDHVRGQSVSTEVVAHGT
jgi:hypothetical protein